MRLPFPLRWETLKAERLTRKHQHNRIANPTVRDNYYQSLALWWVQVCCVYLAAHCSGWMEVRERLCLCPWDVFSNTFHAWRALICAFNTMCTLSLYLCYVQKKHTESKGSEFSEMWKLPLSSLVVTSNGAGNHCWFLWLSPQIHCQFVLNHATFCVLLIGVRLNLSP